MNPHVKSAARSAENSTALRGLARGGYVASGIVHGLIGLLALTIAVTGQGESDQGTALATLASQPFGAVALWVLAALLVAVGVFHLVSGFTQSADDDSSRWRSRLSERGQAAAYVAIGVVAISVNLGNRSDGDANAENASRGLLDAPGGPVMLAIVGIGVGIGGVAFAIMGLMRKFTDTMRIPGGALGTAVTALGVVGHVAKGVSIAVVGGLIAIAAVRNDPESAGALNTAIQTLRDAPGGPVIVAAIGAGFIAYGVFCCLRARYARL